MNVFVYSRCSTVYHIVHRQFRTTAIHGVPRGVTASERRHVRLMDKKQEFEEIDHTFNEDFDKSPPIPPSKKPDPHRDNRAIDSIDPVVLKYVNLLNKCSQHGRAAQEKVHSTHFGAIRFDNDNTPSVHGQFDAVEGPDQTVVVDDVFINAGVNLENLNSESQTSENLEPTTPYKRDNPSEEEKVFEELFCSDASGDDSHAGENMYAAVSSSSNDDLSEEEKAFEELFCSDASGDDSHAGENINAAVSSSSNDDLSTPGAPHDVGLIDNHFFGDLVNRNADLAEMKVIPSKGKFSRPDHTQEVLDTNDLNFVDQTYFKSSLDTLHENRKPAVEFSEIKPELEKAFDNLPGTEPSHFDSGHESMGQEKYDEMERTSNIALNYLGMEVSTESFTKYTEKKVEKKKQTPEKDPPPKSAYEYVVKKRRESHNLEFGLGGDREGDSPSDKRIQKILSLVMEKGSGSFTKYEILSLLKKSIIYDKNDIVALYKPYGIAMHEGSEGQYHILSMLLPELAAFLKAEKLHVIHRLDATTTGVLLLSRTQTMADTLRKMLKDHEIKKTYWAITKGIPSPLQGTIDIPIAEGSVSGKHRMVLRPDLPGFRGDTKKSHQAITSYQVISKNVNAALVELKPKTGLKHQVRVHLGFGLACPILGDHKYSHLKKMAPQRLPGDLLDRLRVKQSRVRDLPIYLHSRSILIPEINDGRNLFIKAKLPAFFNKTLSILKLNIHKNQVKYTDSEYLKE